VLFKDSSGSNRTLPTSERRITRVGLESQDRHTELVGGAAQLPIERGER
jgi:hypothetical protein